MCTIIVADDEYLEREVIKKIVSKISGAEIIGETNSGRKTIELCSALCPDLLIINREMGGIDGLEACKQIRMNDKNVVIALTSALDEKPDKNVLRFANISEFLLKPIRPSIIEELIIKYKKSNTAGQALPTAIKKSFKYYPTHLVSNEIKTALDYINKYYKENISLDDVASKVYLSRYYFSRLFKKEIGVTFSSYVLYKKMEEAKALLENTNQSILDISCYLNFKEQNYFTKVFKSCIGYTPTEYRSMVNRETMNRKIIIDKIREEK